MLFSPSPKRRARLQLRLSERRLLLMAGDALAVVLSVLIALYVWAQVGSRDFSAEFIADQVYWFFLLPVLWLGLAAANDFYDLKVAARRVTSFQRLVLITFQMVVVYLLIFFLSPREALPRLFIIYYGAASLALIGLWRMVNPALMGWAIQARKVLIVGTDWSTETIIDAIETNGHGSYEICGVIGVEGIVGQMIAGKPIVGTGRDLLDIVIREGIAELIFSSVPDTTGDIFRGVMAAYERGVVLTPMPILYERLTGRVPVQHVNTNWAVVLPISGDSIFDPYPVIRWLMNAVLGIIGFLVFLLLLPLTALVIKLDSRGPVFYSQTRMGLNGRPFKIVKFRTMIADAEAQTGAVFSRPGDARVTRTGRFMRRTRLDELPQIMNILKGDMSLVGPRPERPEHVVRLTEKIPFYRTRLVVRPGLTGWAQVRYAYGADDADALVKLEYDLYYIRHKSLLLDVNILIRTVGKVLRMSGV
jgi:exopolysaccharide biosynthesis polyprenyl glycosylphosphotransferase